MSEFTPQERAAIVTGRLANGARLTTRDVAVMTDCHLRTAQRTMNTLARVLPIVEDRGLWRLAGGEAGEPSS